MALATLGIRRETKSPFERRVPLTPEAVATLVRDHGARVLVERSDIRIYPDTDWQQAGAELVDDAFDADLVVAVKEIPSEHFREGGAYLFFSHTIKGQPYNMAMLRRLVGLECTLFDYECVTDEQGRRLIFFSWFAGVAGMVDTLWTYARRMAALGQASPFETVRRTFEYDGLRATEEAIRALGPVIAGGALDRPLVVGIAGYGNVSRGAQHILDLLPVLEVEPDQLHEVARSGPTDRIIKVVFREEHLVEPIAPGAPFELQEYYDHPDRYRSIFENYVDHLDILINGIFWTDAYPRLITLEQLHRWAARPEPMRLQVVGDVSADPHGSVECLVETTLPGDPSYVYNPLTGGITNDLGAEGLAMMAVDILPSELPRAASKSFSEALIPYLPALLQADLSAPLDELDLPGPMRRAMILHRGQFTPEFSFMASFLAEQST